jgi:PAS domain-containing protein
VGIQWIAIFLTVLVLAWGKRGRASSDKKAGISCLLMLLLLNVGYLFELMASGESGAFLAVQIQYGAMIFVGYFMCLFFCYYAKNYAPQWVLVYSFIFDLMILVIVWTSNWHDLIFKNVRYRMTSQGYELFFARGELFVLAFLGCGILPLVVSFVMIVSYISRGGTVRLRRRIALVSVLLLAVYLLLLAFFEKAFPFYYNAAAPISMLLMDLFVVFFWGRDGFHLETATRDIAFDTLAEGVIVTDAAMDLLYYNNAAKKMFPELDPSLMQHNIMRLRCIPLELFEDYEKKEVDMGNRHYGATKVKVTDTWNEIRGYVMVFEDQTMTYNYLAEIADGRKKAQVAEQEGIEQSSIMQRDWENYKNDSFYVGNLSWTEVMLSVKELAKSMGISE